MDCSARMNIGRMPLRPGCGEDLLGLCLGRARALWAALRARGGAVAGRLRCCCCRDAWGRPVGLWHFTHDCGTMSRVCRDGRRTRGAALGSGAWRGLQTALEYNRMVCGMAVVVRAGACGGKGAAAVRNSPVKREAVFLRRRRHRLLLMAEFWADQGPFDGVAPGLELSWMVFVGPAVLMRHDLH